MKKSARLVPPSKEQLKYFLNTDTYLDAPRAHRSVKKQNHPLSLNLVVWCTKIGSKTKELQKSVKKSQFFDVFLVIFEVF